MNRYVNTIAGRLSLRPPQRRSLEIIRRLLSDDGSLLVLCTAFRGRGDCPNITIKKIPKQVPALDFAGVRGGEKRRYIAAVQAGLDRNYETMAAVFRRIINRTLRSQNKVSG